MVIKIRFNTDKDKIDSALRPWRVLLDGVENLAENVEIATKSWTTYDEISPGKFKWHITCQGMAQWDEDHKNCLIR